MSTILKLRDTNVRQALRHPALTGLTRLARGAFCVVYDNGDTVLKLTCDAKQYGLYADAYSPEGPYFPTLVKSYGDVGETYDGLTLYLVEMEKLQPVSSGSSELRSLAKKLIWHIDCLNCYGSSPYKVLNGIVKDEAFPQDLRDAFDALETFVSNYSCGIDFHSENLMRRGEQLVLNDVIVDHEALRRSRDCR